MYRRDADYISRFAERQPPLKAIRSKCVECMGGSYPGVDECASIDCALWPFRCGRDPWRRKPEMTKQRRRESKQVGSR